MAPIDPKQILCAFDLACSETGGLIDSDNIPQLATLIKKHSRKLVSKCTYMNILNSTEESVLEHFLNNDGWNILFDWLKDGVERKNIPFLVEMIALLSRCPVTVIRLQQNDMSKQLAKAIKLAEEGTVLFDMLKALRKKWRDILTNVKLQNGNCQPVQEKTVHTKSEQETRQIVKKLSNGNCQPVQQVKREIIKKSQNENCQPVLEKRKIDAGNQENGLQQTITKKLKSEENVPFVKRINKDKTMNDDQTDVKKTVKCKISKSRSIGLLEKEGATKPASTANTKTNQSNSSYLSKGTGLVNTTASRPTLPLNKLNKSDENRIQLIDAQPLSTNEMLGSVPPHQAKHILKDSPGFFMDALSSSTKMKRKKKVSAEKSPADKATTDLNTIKTETNSQKQQLEMELSSGSAANDSRLSEENSMDHSPSSSFESDFLTFSTIQPFDPCKQAPKSILSIVPRKHNRRISWPDDDRLKRVKLFELHENERVNVNKEGNNSNFESHRKEDRERERKIFTTEDSYMPWKLYPIDFGDATENNEPKIPEKGLRSEEKEIQRVRLSTVIETIFKPDFPAEPEPQSDNYINQHVEKEIPLIDAQLNKVSDHSDKRYKICDGLQAIVNSPINAQLYQPMHPMEFSQSPMGPMNMQYLNQSMYGNAPSSQQVMYNIQPPMPMNQPMQHDSSNNNSWSNQNNYGNNNRHSNKNNMNNYWARNQKRICKFFSKSGNCRNGANCKFLH